jgi:beta-lactamase class A
MKQKKIKTISVFNNYKKKLVKGYEFGVGFKNFTTGQTYFKNENTVLGTGSVIKIAIAITLFDLYQKNKLDIYAPLTLKDFSFFDNKSRDAGILKLFPSDFKINLSIATFLMLSISDNFATNVVLETIGYKNVNAFMKKLGFHNTQVLVPKIDTYLFYEAPHDFGQSTAKELLGILEGLVTNKFLQPENSDMIIKFMSAEGAPYRSLRYLPVGKNVLDKKLEITESYSKGGTFPRVGVCTDVSIIKTKDGEMGAFVVLTKNFQNKNKLYQRNTAIDSISSLFIADVCKELYKNYF